MSLTRAREVAPEVVRALEVDPEVVWALEVTHMMIVAELALTYTREPKLSTALHATLAIFWRTAFAESVTLSQM